MSVVGRLINGSAENSFGCWIWNKCTTPLGYGVIMVNGRTEQAHRASYQEFIGEIPKGLHVLHECDVRNCINPDHLFLGTQQDNMDDMIKKGRRHSSKGSDNPSHKLTEEDVKQIRKLCKEGKVQQKEIAVKFFVDSTTISNINTRKTWKHIKE